MKTGYKCEFHVHTRYSKDSFQSYLLMLLMCRLHGISTIVVTDHDEVKGALMHKRGFRKHGVELIVGEEIFTAEGEIIGINLKSRIEPGLSAGETIRRIREQGGIVYVPHPYDEKRHKTVLAEEAIEKYADEIDLIEIHNGRSIDPMYDVKQKEIADKYGIRGIIGSDAHTFFELGRNYVLTDRKITGRLRWADLEDMEFVKSEFIPAAHTATRIARALKMILRGDIHALLGIIHKKLTRGE